MSMYLRTIEVKLCTTLQYNHAHGVPKLVGQAGVPIVAEAIHDPPLIQSCCSN